LRRGVESPGGAGHRRAAAGGWNGLLHVSQLRAGSRRVCHVIANYIPLQDAYGGPNYFNLDPNAVYKIHVDNDGDAASDLTFEFRFTNSVKDLTVNAGGQQIPIPLINSGPSMRRRNSQRQRELFGHGESPR